MLGDAVGDLALGGGDAGHGLDDDVVAGTVGVGAVVTEGGTLAVDYGRVDGGQGFVVDAQAAGHVGAIVGQDDVGLLGEAADDGGGGGFGEVQGHGTLAPVVGDEGAALGGQDGLGVAPEVAPGGFDLDDAGAHVGQQHAGGGRGDHGGELDDVDAVQRAGHRAVPVGWSCDRRRASGGDYTPQRVTVRG